jgi:hypothetical protein
MMTLELSDNVDLDPTSISSDRLTVLHELRVTADVLAG